MPVFVRKARLKTIYQNNHVINSNDKVFYFFILNYFKPLISAQESVFLNHGLQWLQLQLNLHYPVIIIIALRNTENRRKENMQRVYGTRRALRYRWQIK